jgi:hypothetical protein
MILSTVWPRSLHKDFWYMLRRLNGHNEAGSNGFISESPLSCFELNLRPLACHILSHQLSYASLLLTVYYCFILCLCHSVNIALCMSWRACNRMNRTSQETTETVQSCTQVSQFVNTASLLSLDTEPLHGYAYMKKKMPFSGQWTADSVSQCWVWGHEAPFQGIIKITANPRKFG